MKKLFKKEALKHKRIVYGGIGIGMVVLALAGVDMYGKVLEAAVSRGIAAPHNNQRVTTIGGSNFTSTTNARPSPKGKKNNFGLVTLRPLNFNQKFTIAQELLVSSIRSEVSSLTISGGPNISKYQQAGFNILLNINNNSKPPTHGVTDIRAYQKNVGIIIDTYHPKLIVVENEEDNTTYYKGTSQEYLAELQAAIDVAHSKGLKVADGGLLREPLAYLAWKHLWETGNRAQADTFSQEALAYGGNSGAQLLSSLPTQAHPNKNIILARGTLRTIMMTQALLNGFKKMNLDYVNFHWYENDARGTAALPQIVTYLQAATGKPVISNEFGQLDNSPATTTSLLQGMHELNLAYMVWFSGDDSSHGTPGEGNAPYALQDSKGNLRPNGKAFENFMLRTFQASQIEAR